MELARDEVRVHVRRKLDHLDELAVRGHTAKDQPFPFQSFAKLGVKFIPMTMAFADGRRSAVNPARDRSVSERAWPVAEPHRSAVLVHVNEITQLEDYRERRIFIKL